MREKGLACQPAMTPKKWDKEAPLAGNEAACPQKSCSETFRSELAENLAQSVCIMLVTRCTAASVLFKMNARVLSCLTILRSKRSGQNREKSK